MTSATRDMFVQAMSKAVGSVYAVTTDGTGGKAGMTVSAVSSVSADGTAPTVMVCLHGAAQCAEAVLKNKVFCVNLLSSEQEDLSNCFAGLTGLQGAERFEVGEWISGPTGSPVLQGALMSLECTLGQSQQVGTHHMIIGEVRHVYQSDHGGALLYGNRGYKNAVER